MLPAAARDLLAAKLRSSNVDRAAGSEAELARIVGRIRASWPKVRVLVRADSGLREGLMAWCEANGANYVFGLALKAKDLPLVVIEENRRRVEALRKRGFATIYGDPTAAGVLEAAGGGRARLLIVAAPRGFLTHRIIELARQPNARIRIAMRTRSVAELAHFERIGVHAAIMGETELAFDLLDDALRTLGLVGPGTLSSAAHLGMAMPSNAIPDADL